MLPLLADRLEILLSPDKVQWRRYDWRGRLAAHDVLLNDPAQHRKPWAVALKSLAALFSSLNGRNSVTIVLSNHFVRYAIVPWQAKLRDEEWQAYVRQLFVNIYGDVATDWEVRISGVAEGIGRLASAIDRDFFQNIMSLAHENKITVKSVQPMFMDVFNRHRKTIIEGDIWFIIVEPGKLSAGLMVGREWSSFRSRLIGENVTMELRNFLEQESLITNHKKEAVPVFLYAPGFSDQIKAELSGWKVVCLSDNWSQPSPFKKRLMNSGIVSS